MGIQVQGVIHGNQIELEHETNLPQGSIVLVEIHPKPLALEEKVRLVNLLCGSWAHDASLKAIFEEIESVGKWVK